MSVEEASWEGRKGPQLDPSSELGVTVLERTLMVAAGLWLFLTVPGMAPGVPNTTPYQQWKELLPFSKAKEQHKDVAGWSLRFR